MLAPYFGSSVFVTGSVITIMLLLLSLGYYVGGKLADQQSSDRGLRYIFASSSLYLLALLFSFRPALNYFSGFSTVGGSMISVAALFAFPVVALSFVSPWLIKIHSQTAGVGASAGNIYAVSTLGSILGSLLTTFFLIPKIGVQSALFVNAVMIALCGLGMQYKLFALILALSAVALPSLSYSYTDALYYKESPYNTIFIVEQNGTKYLRLNQNRGEHSVSLTPEHLTHLCVDDFLIGPQLTPVKNLLILGGAAGTSAEQFNYFYRPDRIDLVEIDPDVTATSKIMGLELRNVNIVIEDARRYLRKNQFQFDMIELDMFGGSIYIPYYVATHEFFKDVYRSLSENGIVMMNTVNASSLFSQSIANTIRKVFPAVYSVNDRTWIAYKNPVHKIDARFKKHQPGPRIFTDDLSDLDWQIYQYASSAQRGSPKP